MLLRLASCARESVSIASSGASNDLKNARGAFGFLNGRPKPLLRLGLLHFRLRGGGPRRDDAVHSCVGD